MTGAWRNSAERGEKREEQLFLAELARVRGERRARRRRAAARAVRLSRRARPGAPPASQADIADSVFGQPDTEGDDATARVYVHRLRKRLEEFYAAAGRRARTARGWSCRPALTRCAWRTAQRAAEDAPSPPRRPTASGGRSAWRSPRRSSRPSCSAARCRRSGDAPPANAFWQPFLESDRPIVVVVGDYYMFGEIDPVEPEQSRLIRDFRVNSPMDLAGLQEAEPERYGNAEDVGLTYLPFVDRLRPARDHADPRPRRPRASRWSPRPSSTPDTIREANIVYIGLIGALGPARGHDLRRLGLRGRRELRRADRYRLAPDLHQRRGAPPGLAGVLPRLRLRRALPRARRLAGRGGRRRPRDRAARPRADRHRARRCPSAARRTSPTDDGSGMRSAVPGTGQQGADLSERPAGGARAATLRVAPVNLPFTRAGLHWRPTARTSDERQPRTRRQRQPLGQEPAGVGRDLPRPAAGGLDVRRPARGGRHAAALFRLPRARSPKAASRKSRSRPTASPASSRTATPSPPCRWPTTPS